MFDPGALWRTSQIDCTPAESSAGETGAVWGRSREIGELEAALAEATAGRGQLVLLAGDAGIGKSALAERFAHRRLASVAAW